MPELPKRHCRWAHAYGCKEYEPCPVHGNKSRQNTHGSSRERGYGTEWDRLSVDMRGTVDCDEIVNGVRCGQNHTLCAMCLEEGFYRLAQCVDHRTPVPADDPRFWDHGNHQALCISCHSKKTKQEEPASKRVKSSSTSGFRRHSANKTRFGGSNG